jgi:hypothetical protein
VAKPQSDERKDLSVLPKREPAAVAVTSTIAEKALPSAPTVELKAARNEVEHAGRNRHQRQRKTCGSSCRTTRSRA